MGRLRRVGFSPPCAATGVSDNRQATAYGRPGASGKVCHCAGILLDQIFEAPPVLPIADVCSDRLGLCDAVFEGFDQWIVSSTEHLDTCVGQGCENAVEALLCLGVELGPSRGFHDD